MSLLQKSYLLMMTRMMYIVYLHIVCGYLFHGGQTVVLAGCYGGWRPKSCEILYHLNWLKICGWRFGRAIVVLDVEKISVYSQHFPVLDFFWSEQKVKVATCRSGGPSAPRLLCHQRHLKVSSSSENTQIFKNIQKLFRGFSIWKSLQDSFVLFWLGSKNMIGFCVNYRSSSFPHAQSHRAQIRKPISLSQSVNGESIPWLRTFGKDK